MAEIIEVKHVPNLAKGSNVLVNSLEDLQKIAELNNVPMILKDAKAYYLYIDPTVYRYDVKD